MTSPVSCPHRPAHSCPLLSMDSVRLRVGPPLSLLLFSQRFCLFQRTRPSRDVSEVGRLQFCHFCLQRPFRLNLLWDPLVRLPGSPGSPHSSPPTPDFSFPLSRLLHCPAFPSARGDWEDEGGVVSAVVSCDTSGLVTVLPLPSFCVSALSWLLARVSV